MEISRTKMRISINLIKKSLTQWITLRLNTNLINYLNKAKIVSIKSIYHIELSVFLIETPIIYSKTVLLPASTEQHTGHPVVISTPRW